MEGNEKLAFRTIKIKWIYVESVSVECRVMQRLTAVHMPLQYAEPELYWGAQISTYYVQLVVHCSSFGERVTWPPFAPLPWALSEAKGSICFTQNLLRDWAVAHKTTRLVWVYVLWLRSVMYLHHLTTGFIWKGSTVCYHRISAHAVAINAIYPLPTSWHFRRVITKQCWHCITVCNRQSKSHWAALCLYPVPPTCTWAPPFYLFHCRSIAFNGDARFWRGVCQPTFHKL